MDHNITITNWNNRLFKFLWFITANLLAVSSDGEVWGCLLRESIGILHGNAVLHSSEEDSAVISINFVRHGRWESLELCTSHWHQFVAVIIG